MAKRFNFEGARKAGYSDQEIASHLGESNPNFDVEGAMKAGYSPEEINVHLSEQRQPSRTKSLLSAGVKGLIRGAQNINPLMPRGPISPELSERASEELLPSQEKPLERYVERAGELAPAVAIGPEGLAMKGLQLGAGALGGHLAQEEGFGKGGQIIGEILGFSFPSLMKSLGSKAMSLIRKGGTKAAGEAISKIARVKPEQIQEGVREAADRLGVLEDLPISSQVDNNAIQFAETKLLQSAAGKPLQKKLERAGEKLGETYKGIAKSVSTRENMLPSVISEEAASVLKGMEEASENAYRSLYSQASKALPEGAATLPKVGMAIHKVIDGTIKKLKSALGTPSKDALLNRLNRLKDSWSANPELRAGAIPIKELETLKQDLNQVIKYETKGGVDKILKSLQGITKEGIQSYGREFNQPYLNRFNQAEKLFGENARTFRKDPVMKVLVKGEKPEQIFGRMGTVKGINDLEKVFNRTPEGKEVMDALKRYKLEDLLNRRLLDKSGNISWGKASGLFKEPKTKDLVLKLVGHEQYRKLKDLSKVAGGIEQGFKKFFNPSKSGATVGDFALLVSLPVKAVQQVTEKNVLGAAKSIAGFLGPRQIASLMANPKFVQTAISTAKAGKGTSSTLFLEYAKRLAQITASEILRNSDHSSASDTSQSQEAQTEESY